MSPRIRSLPCPGTSLVFLLLFPLVVADGAAQGGKRRGEPENWPYGTVADTGPGSPRYDLFNMGLLGAKGWDADRPLPSLERESGRRSFKNDGTPGPDVGPKRLQIMALFGGGPAQRAGIRLGDVIVGVDEESFAEGCFLPLATALRAAEAGSGALRLKVVRGGEDLEVGVKITTGGKGAAEPILGRTRDKLLHAALDWLAERQGSDGGYEPELGGMNGQVVNTCLAGLAWIAGGSTQRSGRHKKNLLAAVGFVEKGLRAKDPFQRAGGGDGGSWDQTTWAQAHAALFFGELQIAARSRELQPLLQEIATELCRRQEISGGYAHGPGGKNALGYIELNILGGYVLSGLSVARQAGCEVDMEVVKKLCGYLQESAGDDGGVGYSAALGQKGSGNIGRTAAAWLGAVGLGLRQDDFTGKMARYVAENAAAVMGGHASLMQHIMLAGVAAQAIGETTTAAYWDVMLRDFTLARAPDGSFQARPWHESLLMTSNTDVAMGEVWSTASWAIVLGAGAGKGKKGGLPGWMGQNPD